jgi:predicted ABC-type ATPase
MAWDMAGERDTPQLVIIAGPNGAGKTTFARSFLPKVGIGEFLNADLIAAGLTPLRPEASAFAAGRLLLKLWHDLACKRKDFAFETTLSGRTYAPMLAQALGQGYRISIHYLWVPTVQMCLRRIRNRVKKGGHNVPEADVRRRYPASLRNFLRLYQPLASEAHLWDVSRQPPCPVASWIDGAPTIHHHESHNRIQKQSRQA